MFVKTVKVKKPNPFAIGVILVAILLLIAVWILGQSSHGIGDKYKLPTNIERVEFLSDLGWEVSPNETECKVEIIPEEFNDVYTAYNALQREQGFDLTDHKGHTVEIYTYDVYNYPERPENVCVHLIVCDNVLIGGDVCCTELNGFIHGLMPVKDNSNSNENNNSDNSSDNNNQQNNNSSNIGNNAENNSDNNANNNSNSSADNNNNALNNASNNNEVNNSEDNNENAERQNNSAASATGTSKNAIIIKE